MAQGRYYEFTTHGASARGPDWIPISERDFREREMRVDLLARLVSTAPLWASDLLRIARAVFVVDNRFLREEAPDRWTRTIRLSVQLNQPDAWTPAVLDTLNSLLGHVTGDRWTIDVHPGAAAQTLLDDEPVGEVALFSGGLDSTAYAAHAARRATTPLLLISFDDGAVRCHRKRPCPAARAAVEFHGLPTVGRIPDSHPLGIRAGKTAAVRRHHRHPFSRRMTLGAPVVEYAGEGWVRQVRRGPVVT